MVGEKTSKPKAIVWNEDNLAENEKIKAELNPVKIDEPKTPFHAPLPDEDINIEPLALDRGQAQPATEKKKRLSSARIKPPALSGESDFGAARKDHYNMRDLLANKQAYDDEEDEEEEEENKG